MAETQTTASVGHETAEHAEPTALMLNPGGWVALAMLVVFAIFIWKKVPAAIAKALDHKIAGIRDQLSEAEALRKEAEALKAEYAAKAAAAEQEAEAMVERARHEAAGLIEKARHDAEALVRRRTRMAEEKIAAEQRAAVQQLRSVAAQTAANAAAHLVAKRVDPETDAALVDKAIKELGR
jgi:F-type H+-transporting ATPase subunit b